MKHISPFHALLLALALTACAAGDGPMRNAAPPAASPAAQPGAAASARSVLSTSMPALSMLPAGAEFTFSVALQLHGELYQGSGRVVYDSRLVEPLTATRGGLVPAADVFIAPVSNSLPAAGLPAGAAVVPFAFTGLPGSAPIAPGTGEILQVRFRVRQPVQTARAVYLLNDPAYLQLRDSQGQRLAFDLATVEAGR